MRTVKILALGAFSLSVFVLAFLTFFPCGPAGELLLRRTVRAAGERGLALDASEVRIEGLMPSAELINVRFKSPLLSGEAGRITASFSLRDSLLTLAPVIVVRLERVSANLPVPGEQPLFLDEVEAGVALRRGRLEASDLKASGELAASGRASFSTSPFSLTEADISLGGERAELIRILEPLLPLRRDDRGGWRLKKEGRGSGGSR